MTGVSNWERGGREEERKRGRMDRNIVCVCVVVPYTTYSVALTTKCLNANTAMFDSLASLSVYITHFQCGPSHLFLIFVH